MAQKPTIPDIEEITHAPVLPVRDTVHFPGVIQTLLIGRDLSLKALHEALESDR